MTDITIGADPELWVRDREGNLISAYGMIPGTKECPFEVEGGAVQVDGMALEFNINPSSTFEEFNGNINSVLSSLKKMIPDGYEFDFSPVAEFGKEYIEAQPDEAKELGCNPDFSAYTGLPNPKPDTNYPFRTASGHVHIGWTNGQDIDVPEHIEACKMAVMQLDNSLGFAAKIWDKDKVRSKMYGNWGAFRPKHYGVEYRTPSNVWVRDEEYRKIVFDISMQAIKSLLEGRRFYDSTYAPDMNMYKDAEIDRRVVKFLSYFKIDRSTIKSLEDISSRLTIPDQANIKMYKPLNEVLNVVMNEVYDFDELDNLLEVVDGPVAVGE